MPHAQAFAFPSGIWNEGPFRFGFQSLSKRANLLLFTATATATALCGMYVCFGYLHHVTQVSYGHFQGKSLVYKGSMAMTHEVPKLVTKTETMKE